MNIEKTISEHAVSDILTPMLESQDRIVTEDVAPLFDQATGLDTPTASGSVTTTIEESRSVITAIIRKAWTATLTMLGGASVISSIAAAYTYLRNRLQGNETYGIPDRRSEISASSPLAANLALLNDRKIGGVPEAVDGMSMANLIGSAARNDITEITDPNKGWTMDRNNIVSTLVSIFSGLDTVTLGCGTSTQPIAISVSGLKHLNLPELEDSAELADRCDNIESIYIPKLKHCQMAQNYGRHNFYFIGYNKCTDIDAPELESFGGPVGLWGNSLFRDLPNCKKISAPKLTTWNYQYHHSGSCAVWNCPELEELDFRSIRFSLSDSFTNCPKLIKLVLTLDYSQSLALWEPDLSDSDVLALFLENFRDYIANRLKGGYPIGQGPILTLSQAVHNAITAAEDDYHIREIITQKGWTISPAPN